MVAFRFTKMLLTIAFLLLSFAAQTADMGTPHPRFKAVAFDYFVLFDPNSIIPAVEKIVPGKAQEFTRTWRSKQFEYGFLRSITGHYADFFEVTGDALDYTAAAMHVKLDGDARTQLLHAYLTLTPWPDAKAGLERLRERGLHVITIANFSPQMLRENADHAGLTAQFDKLLSTSVNRTYKPDSRAYALGLQELGLKREEIVFAAFGGWDAYGAKRFGYPTYWVNRFDLPPEQLGTPPDGTSKDMTGLLQFVLGDAADPESAAR